MHSKNRGVLLIFTQPKSVCKSGKKSSLQNVNPLRKAHAFCIQITCPGGEIGRHNGLKIRRNRQTCVPVRFRFRAPTPIDTALVAVFYCHAFSGFIIPYHSLAPVTRPKVDHFIC